MLGYYITARYKNQEFFNLFQLFSAGSLCSSLLPPEVFASALL
jgi:hypothetical protein